MEREAARLHLTIGKRLRDLTRTNKADAESGAARRAGRASFHVRFEA